MHPAARAHLVIEVRNRTVHRIFQFEPAAKNLLNGGLQPCNMNIECSIVSMGKGVLVSDLSGLSFAG